LNEIGGSLQVGKFSSSHSPINYSLTSLTGLDNITSIGGDLIVTYNDTLTTLSGLDALISIGGDLEISSNYSLNSLSGLDNIDVSTINNFKISGNFNISYCNYEWVCEYLQNPNGIVSVGQNGSNCTSIVELANSCGGDLPCLPYGDYSFYTEDDIFMFQYAFDNCSDIKGNVLIQGSSDISTLYYLNNWTSVEKDLIIRYCSSLEDLEGLNNLLSVGADLGIIHNEDLVSLQALNNITEVGAQLRLVNNDALAGLAGLENITMLGGDLEIYGNQNLISIDSLRNLESVGGDLRIFQNESIESLAGIDNIEAESIEYLQITDNPLLSTCQVLSVCNYLGSPSSVADISVNASGCASRYEVEEACGITAIDEQNLHQNIFVYPNPSTTQITLDLSDTQYKNTSLTISNISGQQLQNRTITELITEIDISDLPTGIYIIKVWNDKNVMIQRVIKQ